MPVELVDVLVVGGGPAGLSAASELRRLGVDRVIVVDRELELGGIPRHSSHGGYGLRDLHRFISGPTYARSLVRAAERAGAELRPATSVIEWTGDRRVRTTSENGVHEIEARAVVLATGCRERPRSARLVPGDRPAGIFTTGSLQQSIHLYGLPVGTTAIVVGAEHVSFSAVMSLRHAGVRVTEMITEHPRHQTFQVLRALVAGWQRVPITCSARVTEIIGRERAEAVEVTDLETGSRRRVACDTVVFTGDWRSENELARSRGIVLDPGTAGPQVDWQLHTSAAGICAAGNVLHGAESADVAALEGRRAAATVVHWLASGEWPNGPRIPVVAQAPLTWAFPNEIQSTPAGSAQTPLTVRTDRFLERSAIEVRQNDKLLWRGRMRGPLVPNRSIRIPSRWAASITDTAPIILSAA